VTSLESWFESTQHLENFTALNSWEVSQYITNISKMFLYSNLRNVTDLSNWYTANVTDMSRIFEVSQFNGDISTWDTGNVTNMLRVFAYNQQFNQDISGWDVSNVTSMNTMFQFASTFNQDISSWNVGNVLDMDAMFIAAGEFNQDLSGWCVTNIPTEPYNFAAGTNSWTLPKPI
jgi:surface protein